MQWIGDGLYPPETDEMVGTSVNKHGRKGIVVSNTAFTITVEWEKVAMSDTKRLWLIGGIGWSLPQVYAAFEGNWIGIIVSGLGMCAFFAILSWFIGGCRLHRAGSR